MRVEQLSSPYIKVASELGDLIYPPELWEPFKSLESRWKQFPEGSMGLFDDDKLVGYCFFHPWHENQIVPLCLELTNVPKSPICYIHDLAILPKYRGNGNGRFFAGAVIEKIRSLGFSKCALVAVLGAERFWCKMGFRSLEEFAYGPTSAIRMEMELKYERLLL